MAAAAEIHISGNIDDGNAEKDSASVGSFLKSESTSNWSLPGWLSSSNSLLAAQKGTGAAAAEWLSNRRQGWKSLRVFFDTKKFKAPTGIATVGRRVVSNIEIFQSNYLSIFVVLFIYCILTSPLLLIALATCLGLIYFIRVKSQTPNQLVIAGRQISSAYQYGIVAALSFPLFYLAGAGATIFWVIGASIFLILLHAVFYASEPVPGAEFEMEEV